MVSLILHILLGGCMGLGEADNIHVFSYLVEVVVLDLSLSNLYGLRLC